MGSEQVAGPPVVVGHCCHVISLLGAGCPTGLPSPSTAGTMCPMLAGLARAHREEQPWEQCLCCWGHWGLQAQAELGSSPVTGILRSLTLAYIGQECLSTAKRWGVGPKAQRIGLEPRFSYPRTLLGPKTCL